MRHGGQILVDHLKAEGVDRVFSIPGESFLAALDGLYESGIHNVVCRHEGAAAMMAEATGKLTGRPGVAFVTRGPGATNASAGVHIARQDSTPMILFVGQIDRGHRDREVFQEVDYRAMFAPLAKWATEVEDTDRLPEYLSRAFHVARSGRPGPVVVALPEDMLSAKSAAEDLAPTAPISGQPGRDQVQGIIDTLHAAERPLIIAGGSGWTAQAARDLQTVGERLGVPVAVSFRRQDYIDNRSPAYAGDLGVGANPALAGRLRSADTILALGSRLTDIATGGFANLDPANPGKTILQVHPAAEEIGKVFRVDQGVLAHPKDVLSAMADMDLERHSSVDWARAARADYEAWQQPVTTPGDVRMEDVIRHLADVLPEDAILTNGAGNYAAFLHRYYRFKAFGTQLAPTSGSMGYGLPAAIAAKVAHPERVVICLAGDGCFQMTGNEMATAVQEGANIVVIVANNGRYGTIRMHQEKTYPGRVSGTEMGTTDFAALANAFGGFGQKVTQGRDFPEALQAALGAGRPALIELSLDPRMLSTSANLA